MSMNHAAHVTDTTLEIPIDYNAYHNLQLYHVADITRYPRESPCEVLSLINIFSFFISCGKNSQILSYKRF